MAATLTNRIRFEDFLFQQSGTPATVEGLESMELVMRQNLPETGASTPVSDSSYCRGVRSYTINLAGAWIETGPECGLGATLSLDAGTGDIKGVGDITINSTAEVGDVTTQSSSGAREIEPGKRASTVTMTGVYFDPLGTGANNSEMITDAISGNQTISVLADFGTASSFAMTTAYSESVTITRTDDESVMQLSGVLRGSGATITATFANATNLDVLTQSIYTAAKITWRGTPSTSGMTRFDGAGYITALTINIPLEGPISWQMTLEGDGAITETAITP